MAENLFSRRRFVATAGTTTLVLLAGCSDQSSSGDNGGDGGSQGETGGDDSEGNGNDTGQENDTPENGTDNESETENESTGNESTTGSAETIELGAQTQGWQGQAPAAIEGQTNPTLPLEPGTTYELMWENLDGEEHELIIEDANGSELQASDSSEEQGQTITMTVEASEEMAQYYCEYHPEMMRGDIGTSS